MSPQRTHTQSIESDLDSAVVFAFLRDPRNLPHWAPGFAGTISGDEKSGWVAEKDSQTFALRVPVSEASTVDFPRSVAPGVEGGAYTRVVPRVGGGCVVTVTLPILPGSTAADIEEIARKELDDLVALARPQ